MQPSDVNIVDVTPNLEPLVTLPIAITGKTSSLEVEELFGIEPGPQHYTTKEPEGK